MSFLAGTGLNLDRTGDERVVKKSGNQSVVDSAFTHTHVCVCVKFVLIFKNIIIIDVYFADLL